MFRLLGLVASLALVLGFAASCGESSTPTTDGGVKKDGKIPGTDGTVPKADGTVQPPANALLQTIMDKLALPTKAGEYGVEFADDPGKPKNQLGTLIAAIQSFFPDLQKNIDSTIAKGDMIMLYELFGTSLQSDTNVTAQAHVGADTDGDATNNFSGTASIGLASFSPKDALLKGSITGGKLAAGPGSLVIPLNFIGQDVVLIKVEQGRATADVSAAGLKNAVMGGAVPKSEMDGKLLPLVVGLINQYLPTMDATTKNLVLGLIDTNKNGTIEVADLQSGVVGNALKPDVALGGPGAPKDALSIGVGFSSVPCKIQK